MDDVMRVLLEPYADDRIADAVAAYRADYGQHGLFDSLPYTGINRALAEMQSAGARLYLATSKRTCFAKRMLEHLDLTVFFDGIYGSETGGALDHKPELISHIVVRHALVQSRCVMVGDRRYDIAGAHANKMRAVGVLWGYGSRDELEAAGAEHLIAEPESLAAIALAMATTGMH
jgi:phosphoglycolate phosphatase